MARKSPAAPDQGGRIVDIDVQQEMRSSFLEYAYSVIYSRALPDARDGLKPVQRRILFQMAQMGLRPERGHVKSARVVGEVMGRLHPHGDTAIYDALVRMAQPFALRLPLVDGHGNFGSLDDGPAAMRYTEARLAPSAMDMTATLDEDVVDFIANYDGREQEPVVLPAAIPNLLVNGAAGIAVGMATNLVPHNLVEVINAARLLINKPKSSLDDIMAVLPGPDLPGGGIIIGLDGIRDAYATGRGSFRVRARATIEQVSARRRGIVVTELPMAVGPERIIERVKDLVQAKKIEGIADITDLSDGDSGLRLVIEVKSGYHPEAVLESLYRLTPMEDTVNINAVALVDGQPHTLGLLDLLAVFINHRLDVVRRRSTFRRARAMDRLHLVEGVLIAILDIDEVIQLIRASDDVANARERLMSVFDLTELQANYILEMPLRRLTKFSRLELEKEQAELQETIQALERLLKDDKTLRTAVSDELAAVARTHGTPRRSILASEDGVVLAQVPLQEADEPCLVMLSGTGMIGRLPASADQLAAWAAGDQDGPLATEVVASAVATTARGQVGLVTSSGQVIRVDVMELPMLPQGAPIGALVDAPAGDTLLCLMPLDEGGSLVLGTASGIVKRVTADFPASKDQWEVIRLGDGDQVVAASTLPEAFAERCDLVLISDDAQLLRFSASDVRAQGRSGGGVQGMRLSPGARLLACAPVPSAAGSQAVVVTVAGSRGALPGTEGASVKVTALQAFPGKGRATAGVRCHKFRADEDALTAAWAGLAPARAVSIAGAPVRLPAPDERRDGTGSPVPAPIAAIGGRWW